MPDTPRGDAHTFIFADLAGYTALTEVHGDEQAADVVGDFCRSVRALVSRHGATEVKSIGDAVMVHAEDPAAAVHIARHIVDEIGSRHAFPTVRVGVHTGAAVEREGDWFGSAVNVAARVADAADEREVLVTAATWRSAAERLPDLEFLPAGARRLKNVSEPVEVFRAMPVGAAIATGMPTDPVCRMVIDPARAAAVVTHHGRDHHFCSERCRDAFVRNPALYSEHRQPGRRRLLVSDDARERAVRRLGRAYSRGRLESDDLEERVERAYAARTRGELQTLTRDLPGRRPRRRWWWAFLPWTWFRPRRRRRTTRRG